MTMNSQLRVSNDQFSQAIQKLGEFVAIPSVSNPGSPDYNMNQLINAAQFAENELRDLNFDVRQIRIEGSAPFVLAKKVIDANLPTIILYAHYDVQPVDRDKWKSDPFVMVERDGRLYGRGASDDKGGIIGILTALRVFKEAGKELPVNVTILFEGEEEYGSTHMNPLLRQEAENLNAHAMVVLDALNRSVNEGTLTSSTRGIAEIKLRVDALEKPVHSGVGCLVPCPATRLAQLVSSLADPLKIDGFMDGHVPLEEAERETLRRGSLDVATYGREQGLKEGISLRGDNNLSVYERIVEEPSISIVNMNCGQPDGGNSIQESAQCTISVRVLPGQDPVHVANSIEKHLRSQPDIFNFPITISHEEGAFAWKANLSNSFSTAYLQALEENFAEAVAMPCGGALPLLHEFEQIFPNMCIIAPGVEDPDTSAHSHDESQHIGLFRKSIDSLVSFLDKASTIK